MRRRGAVLAALAMAPLLLGGCDTIHEWTHEWQQLPPGFLGAEIRTPAKPTKLTDSGGLHGELIGASREVSVPPAMVDNAISPEIARWLRTPERQALADASQYAVTGVRNVRLAWQATEPNGSVSAAGWIAPVSDPYRSPHGLICRDVRQALVRKEQSLAQEVSLCREDLGTGTYVWTIPHWP